VINSLTLKNFKCFEQLFLEMSNLNVFAGINSMGKSTIIQALLLLRQSYEMGSMNKGIHLNGDITKIGTGYDLLYRNSEKDELEIQIECKRKNYFWKYEYNKDSDFQKLQETNTVDDTSYDMNLFHPTFAYVSAERIGPQRIYEKSYHEVVDKNQLGYRGELFADYVAERGLIDKVENINVLHRNVTSQFLLNQTQAWLSEISPGIKITPKKYTEAGLVGVEYGKDSFNPLNVGFGLSYVAPIIVSLLKAKQGDLIILENPEAHLHPKGQRKMGELIAKACTGGVQVMLETHSDHLLNGIRLAVKQKVINRNLIRLNYFYQTTKNNKLIHTKSSPAILDDGSLSDWPDGFFDEWEKAIDELF
jgi:predicted ATPase